MMSSAFHTANLLLVLPLPLLQYGHLLRDAFPSFQGTVLSSGALCLSGTSCSGLFPLSLHGGQWQICPSSCSGESTQASWSFSNRSVVMVTSQTLQNPHLPGIHVACKGSSPRVHQCLLPSCDHATRHTSTPGLCTSCHLCPEYTCPR
jgi:hypothetical protein